MKHCETFEHTADLGLAGWGDSLAELLEALAEGLTELVCPLQSVRPVERRTLSVEGPDVETLTVDFLGEVLGLVVCEKFCVREVRVREAQPTRVRAEILGEPLDAERHELGAEVKAVTQHGLHVAREGDRWIGRVLLDL